MFYTLSTGLRRGEMGAYPAGLVSWLGDRPGSTGAEPAMGDGVRRDGELAVVGARDGVAGSALGGRLARRAAAPARGRGGARADRVLRRRGVRDDPGWRA